LLPPICPRDLLCEGYSLIRFPAKLCWRRAGTWSLQCRPPSITPISPHSLNIGTSSPPKRLSDPNLFLSLNAVLPVLFCNGSFLLPRKRMARRTRFDAFRSALHDACKKQRRGPLLFLQTFILLSPPPPPPHPGGLPPKNTRDSPSQTYPPDQVVVQNPSFSPQVPLTGILAWTVICSDIRKDEYS